MIGPLSRLVDTALDRTIAPGYTTLGLAVRRRLPGWPADPAPGSMDGRVALVTGASSGLGIATAEGLAALGAEVHLVVRDTDKARGVAGVTDDRIHRCDIGDLDDVRRFVSSLGLSRIDVLVHNAGVMPPERTESPQGHELSMAVHVLGPVLMTDLLLPALHAAEDARVVLVTSGGMYGQALRADDPDYLKGGYSPTTAYARSKRAQVELVPALARRWAPVAVQVMHPGWADTPGVVDSLPTFHKVVGPLLRDPAQGADTTVWLAAAQPPPPSGLLWHDRRPRPTSLMRRTRPSVTDVETMQAWVEDALGSS